MPEFYMDSKGRLIGNEEWREYIEALKSVSVKADENILSERIRSAIVSRLTPQELSRKKKVAVLFSGGVDSTLIALTLKSIGLNPVCISVGVHDGNTRPSPDILYAREISEELALEYHEVILDLSTTARVIKKIIPIVGTDIVRVGVGAVTYSGISKAAELGIRSVFSGLGSEEVFAGYDRHTGTGDINSECWRGLHAMHDRDIQRDTPIAQSFRCRLHTPFLDKEVIMIGMGIPGSRKISKTNNKLPVRRVAYRLGLRRRYSYRKKNAAQYGSNIDRAIQKLAKQSGFRYKKDYLQSLSKP